MTTWENVAVPSVLFGCESVLFSDTKLGELEVIQSQVAKRILGVPKNTSNICAQTELGFKPIKLRLILFQLQFYFRVLGLPNSRWVKIALLDHLTGSWVSPYIQYISKLRSKVSLYDPSPTLHYLRQHAFKWALFDTNQSLMNSTSLSGIPALESFKKAEYLFAHLDLNLKMQAWETSVHFLEIYAFQLAQDVRFLHPLTRNICCLYAHPFNKPERRQDWRP